ncbi:hypothetical protein B0I35DRAFT_453649 [Stachybotrys elegans]|uniref:DUF7924 domain-containing protein n=1 Tax=Stachybotrys elegans TaxID=80388 RepID=A0A8K0SIQ2_9HYPO|nr:hypothetical protein B0I35DRAFT_453649 [Stachybotrys elegans]
MNLAANNIFIRALHDPLPPRVADIVRLISLDRGSPEPLREDIEQDEELNELWLGAGEHQVEHYFKHAIFPNPGPIDSLRRVDRQPMAKHTVPTMGFGLNISNPVPDMLYGYNRPRAFHQQQSQLISMGAEMVANDEGLMHPFLLVEFEGQGPSGGGNLWAATNQCLGGSASCVNMAETFNQRLRQCRSSSARPIDSVVFSVATNGTEARLYVTWCQFQLDYYMARVGSFLLHDPEHYLNFRKYVRNILDWGNGQRLDRIRGSLDCLFEDGGN